MKLLNEGLGTREIAERLGVCSRTVRRDMKKLYSYILGQVNRKRYLLDQQRRQELEALSTVELEQRFQMLTRLMFHTRKVSKQEEHNRHNKLVLIDLDSEVNGYPKTQLVTKETAVSYPCNFIIAINQDGQRKVIGGFKIG